MLLLGINDLAVLCPGIQIKGSLRSNAATKPTVQVIPKLQRNDIKLDDLIFCEDLAAEDMHGTGTDDGVFILSPILQLFFGPLHITKVDLFLQVSSVRRIRRQRGTDRKIILIASVLTKEIEIAGNESV